MANNIDKRIVEMQFDNAQFEKGVSTSLESLEKLKKGLELDSAVESLKNVETKLNKMDFSGIANSLSEIQGHFTTLGRNIDRTIDSIIENAKSKLLNFYKSTISGGSGSGFSKYETQTKAVQTITNATGKSVAEVEAVLSKLQYYTDQTSYDFAEMSSTIGKFTSVGVDLERAETAMEGIANVAAVSGAGKAEANRAMYNFAQSLSQGSVKLIDWKSIENANMATKEFKEELIKTAISMGTITKVTDTAGKIVTQTKAATKKTAAQFKETAVDYKTFNETLKDGWLTSDVLITTLERYANREDGVGKKAYEAAKQALTFTDAVDAIKDAISSSWMTSFKLMFGDLNESISLWTGFCEAIIEVTDEIGSYRNEVLQGWHEQGGYNDMIESAKNIWSAFVSVLHLVRDAFNSIIPATTAEDLVSITSKIKEVTESWKNFFDYTSEATTTETIKELVNYAKEFEDNIKSGMSGDYVKLFQQALTDAGYTLDKYGADGIYGTETQNALKRLQKDLGVSQTGQWDEATRKAAILSGKFQTMEEVTKEITKGVGETYTVLESYTDKIDYAEQIRTGLKYTDPTKESNWDILEDSQTQLLNMMLVQAGYLDNAQATAFFGPNTEAALKKLQAEYGIAQTGIWDEQTKAVVKANGIFSETVTKTKEVTKTVGAQNSAMERLMTAIQGVASAWSIVTNLFKLGVKVLSYIGSLFSPVVDGLLTISSVIGTCLISLNDFLNKSGAYDAWFSAIKAALTPFGNLLKTIGDGINNFFLRNKNITTFTALWKALKEEISKNKVFKTIITYLEKFWNTVQKTGTAMKSLATVAKTWIVNKLTDLFTKGKDGATGFQKAMSGMVSGIVIKFDELKKKYPIIDYLAGKFNTVKDVITTFYESAKTKLSGFFDSMGNFNSASFLDWIKEKIEAAKAAIISFKDSASESLGKVGTYFTTAYNNVTTWFTNLRKNYPIIDTVATAIEKVFGSISSFASSVKEAFTSAFSSNGFDKAKFFETVKEKFDEFKQNLLNFINWVKISFVKFSFKFPWISNLVSFLKDATNTLKDFATAVKDSIINVFTKDTSGDSTLLDKIKTKLEGLQPIVDWFIGVKDKLVEAWNSLFGGDSNGGKDSSGSTVLGFAEAAQAFFEKIKSQNWTAIILGAVAGYLTLKGLSSLLKGFENISNFLVLKQGGKQATPLSDTFLKIAGAVAIVAASVGLLSLADSAKVAAAAETIKEVILTMAGIAAGTAWGGKAIGDTSGASNVLKLALSVAAVAIGLGIMVYVINTNTPEKIDEATERISNMIYKLAVIETAISYVGKGGTGGMNFGSIIGMCIGVGILVIALWGMVELVKNNKKEDIDSAFGKLEGMIITLGVIEILIAALSKNSKVKISGVLGFAVSLLLIVRAMKNVTNLVKDDAESTEKAFWYIEGLMIVLGAVAVAMSLAKPKISNAIASAGIFISMAYSIKIIAAGLADAVVKVKDVDTDKMITFFAAVEIIAASMAAISVAIGGNVGASLLGDLGIVALGVAIAAFIELVATAGADAVNKVATALWTLGTKMESFSNSMSNVDFAKVNTGMEVFKNLALRILEVAALSIGQGDVRGFVSCLQDLGTGLSNFSNNVGNATLDKYSENGEFNTCVKALGKLLKSQDLTGHSENKTKNFTSALQSLGGGLGNFIDEVKDMDLSSYTGDDSAFKAGVLSLADLLSDTTITGVESGQTTAFTDELTDLSAGLVTFEGNVKQIGEGAMTNANDLISQAIAAVSMVNVRLNASDIETMKTLLEKVSAAVQLYYNNLAKVDPSSAGATPEQIKAAFTGLSGAMPDDSEIASVAAYADGSDKAQSLLDFAEGLVNLGSAISSYGDNIGKLNPLKVMVANSVLKTVSDLQTNLAGDDSNFLDMKDEVAAANTRNPLNQFGRNLINLGTAIGNYAEKISGINPEEVKAANSVIETVAAVPSALNETASSGFWGFMTVLVGKEKTLQGFATDVRTLGTAIRKYALNIKGISSTDIETANTVIDKVSSIPTVLNKDDADAWEFFKSLFRHRQTITDFATDIGNLGGGLATYATDIGGLSYWKITLANSIIDKIANISLPSTGGFWQFLTGSQSLGNFASNLGSVGAGVKEFAEKVSEAPLDNIDMAKALSPITILAEAQSKLKDTGGLKSLLGGDANLGALGANLSEYGDKLVEFSGKVKEFKSEDISQAVEAMKSVIDQQVRIGSRYTNINAFSELGNAINSFFLTLSTYATGGTGATMADDVTNLVYDLIIDICDAISGETSKTNIGSAVKTLFSTATVAIYGYKTQFSLAAKGLIDETKTALGDPDGKIKSSINSAVSGAVSQVRNRYNDFYNAGNYLDQGLVVGIWKGSSAVSTTAWNVAVSAYNAACRALGIASPSKEFAKIGMFADMGLVNGLETYSDAVQSSASDVASGAIDGAQQGLTNFSSLIFDNMDDTPVIRPVLDLTDVQAGANAMNGMFRSQTVGLRSAELANRVSVSDYERTAAASVNTDSSDIRGSIEMLNARIDELGQRIMNMQVVTETGAIVGAITPAMDKALGNRSILAKRGVI